MDFFTYEKNTTKQLFYTVGNNYNYEYGRFTFHCFHFFIFLLVFLRKLSKKRKKKKIKIKLEQIVSSRKYSTVLFYLRQFGIGPTVIIPPNVVGKQHFLRTAKQKARARRIVHTCDSRNYSLVVVQVDSCEQGVYIVLLITVALRF